MEPDIELGPNTIHNVNAPVPVSGEAQAYPPSQPHGQSHVQSEKSFSDPSGPLFSMYLERAEEEDRRMVENWKGDADGILVFTGLFSASVATFLGNTYQGLQLNSQDASAFYLSRIYQQSASGNGSQVSIPSTISDPATFSPSTTTVWVNALWFLSLVISLTCALLATMLQQWARHYLRVTQTRYQPYKRARIRSFYAEGVEKFRVSWAVDALPTLLHLSVFLFYAGLSALLFSVNLTIFKVVVSWVALCLSLYVVITILPAVFPNSPYRTPLSTLCWMAPLYVLRPPVNVLRHILHRLFTRFGILSPVWRALSELRTNLQVLVTNGMVKSAEKAAMNQPLDADSRALAWTYDSLDEDHELEQFLAGVLGLLNSRMVKQPVVVLARVDALSHRDYLIDGALDLISRPIEPSLSPQAAQRRRFKICSESAFALLPIHNPRSMPWWLGLGRSDFLLALERMAKDTDQDLVVAANCMALLYFLSFSWVDMDTSVTASISRITGLPLLTDWTTWSRLDVRYAATLHFIRHVALPYLDGPSRTTHAKAITATLLHMQLGPVSVSLPDEIRYSLCEIWNRTVRIAPDRDEHRVALHILACLHPFYSQSHLHVFATASEQSQGAETYDELIALEQSDFLPCAAASHRRPPSRAPFVTAPPSDPAIPVTPTTPGTNKTLVPGASFTSLPTVDLSFPVDSPVRSNHFTLPVAVSTSQQNILPPSNPVDTDNLTK